MTPEEATALIDEAKPVKLYSHPLYERWRYEWVKAYDFLRGGKHVTEPAIASTSVAFLRRNPEYKDEDEDADRYTYEPTLRASYLYSHVRESEYRWRDRNRRAEHIPVFKPIAHLFASSLHQMPPTRTFEGKEALPEIWRSYVEDVDLRGTGMDAFMEGRTRWTLAFGRSHALTDVPAPEGPPPRTLADQEAQGLRAYSTPMTPLSMPNWCVDRFGQYRWIIVAEEADEGRGPTTPPPTKDTSRRRVWYPNRWVLYEPHQQNDAVEAAETKLWVPVSHGRAPGLVPLSTYYADKAEARAETECDSPLASILGVDVAVFNLLSQLDETELLSVYNQLAMEGDGGDVDGGEATVLYYPVGGRPPTYIAPPDETAQGKWNRIIARIYIAAKQALSSRGRAEFSKEERSAEALGVEYQDRYNLLSSLAGCTEDAEAGQFRHVAAWHGQQVVPRAAYQKQFDFRSISQAIMDTLGLMQLPVGAEAKVATLERVVDRALKAQGAPQESRERAVRGVKEAVLEAVDLQKQAIAAAQSGPQPVEPAE